MRSLFAGCTLIMVRNVILAFMVVFVVAACDVVPKEAVELSNTVGKDLEEVHRAHRELANLHFGTIESEINRFVDDTYRPAYIKKFAEEFGLAAEVTDIIDSQYPEDLLPTLVDFVEIAHRDIEAKRQELLVPIQTQKEEVIEEIDAAHRGPSRPPRLL